MTLPPTKFTWEPTHTLTRTHIPFMRLTVLYRTTFKAILLDLSYGVQVEQA